MGAVCAFRFIELYSGSFASRSEARSCGNIWGNAWMLGLPTGLGNGAGPVGTLEVDRMVSFMDGNPAFAPAVHGLIRPFI